MIQENLSKYNLEETCTKLTEAIDQQGWKLSHTHDLQQTMAKFERTVNPVKVFEICNPVHAYEILSRDTERIVVSMMPCRIAVYEKSDGKVYVSRMDVGELASHFGGIVEEVMKKASAESETILKSVL